MNDNKIMGGVAAFLVFLFVLIAGCDSAATDSAPPRVTTTTPRVVATTAADSCAAIETYARRMSSTSGTLGDQMGEMGFWANYAGTTGDFALAATGFDAAADVVAAERRSIAAVTVPSELRGFHSKMEGVLEKQERAMRMAARGARSIDVNLVVAATELLEEVTGEVVDLTAEFVRITARCS